MAAKQLIHDYQLPKNLEDSVESIAKNQGFRNYEKCVKKLSTDGGSYMGILYEIDLKGKVGDENKEINIFVKNIVQNANISIYSVPGVFETEAWVYKDLSTIFKLLQDEENIPFNERFKMPYSFQECNPKSIILEHLGKKGFKLYNRMEIVPLQYAERCTEELAKFHALSFVIQEKRPEYFKNHVLTKKQPYNFGEEWYAFVENIATYSINCLTPEVKEKVKKKLLQKAANYPKYMTDTSTVRTLCHGDYKLNNIMAKEVNGEVVEVVTIDYQILHYGCPVLDFIYFIFHGTDQEFRREHMINLKNLYFRSMKAFLEKFEMDIDKLYSITDFEKDFREKLDFGLMVNIFYAPFLFALEEEAPDVTTEDLSSLKFKVDDKFTERFRGVVDDFIQWGYV
ncbi:unnamed protein product [Arctia plantaginis]|uniref:CHK kinase-like domain-containing protein n=1 Tax=Arctia plantaginis TaxID=874455 RepID=A0A8S0YME5_ARCPL|nr:unnamed protein product [Arctia plantaginis]